MKGRTVLLTTMLGVLLISTINGCVQGGDSCDDLAGYHTHSTIEITGIDSASVLKSSPTSDILEAVDQFNCTEFSNLLIKLDLSWIEEQHRFRTTNTFLQSFLDWFIPPAVACSFAPYYEEYIPAVSRIEIHSDTDLNADYIAGSDLSDVFTVNRLLDESTQPYYTLEDSDSLSAREYSFQAAFIDDTLVATPDTPATHVFTIVLSLDDGRAFDVQTPAVLFDGV